MPDADPSEHPHRPPLIQREIVLLVALCVLAVGVFAATRRMAAWSRTVTTREAAAAFARGEAARTRGDADGALTAFRRAASSDRQNQQYRLALARTLAERGDREEAAQLLLQLRDENPDGIEVNYRLARLAGDEGRFDDAVRYYNNALYGISRGGVPIERYRIRMELIALLVGHGADADARDELAALSRELPNDAGVRADAAALAARVAPAATPVTPAEARP